MGTLIGEGAAIAGELSALSTLPTICLGASCTTPASVAMEVLKLFLGDIGAGVWKLLASTAGARDDEDGCGATGTCWRAGAVPGSPPLAPAPDSAVITPSTWILPSRWAATAAARKNRERNCEWPDAAVDMSSPPPSPLLPPSPPPPTLPRFSGLRTTPSSHWMCDFFDLLVLVAMVSCICCCGLSSKNSCCCCCCCCSWRGCAGHCCCCG